MKIEKAERLKELPPYLFAEIDKLKIQMKNKGVDIIDLGIGDPDQPTPPHIVAKLEESARDPHNHHYPSYEGLPKLRETIAWWYKKRFKVVLNPENEVLPLIGAKEGIGHFPLAYINKGDIALIPDPAYPVYKAGTIFARGIPYLLPLLEKNNFLPDLKSIDKEIAKKAKIIFLNYPNNPTGATAEKDFFVKLVKFAQEYELIVCHDATYSEIFYNGYKPPSFLEVSGAKEVGIEFHSFSKTYAMTGWRIGWACGNAKILKRLKEVKTNLDSGIFQAIQYAGIEALKSPEDCLKKIRKIYQERRDILVNGLNNLGWEIKVPKATFYFWVRIPEKYNATEFATLLLQKAGIVVTPGAGFGKYGEGYIRISLTVDKEKLKESIARLKKLNVVL